MHCLLIHLRSIMCLSAALNFLHSLTSSRHQLIQHNAFVLPYAQHCALFQMNGKPQRQNISSLRLKLLKTKLPNNIRCKRNTLLHCKKLFKAVKSINLVIVLKILIWNRDSPWLPILATMIVITC